MQQVKFDEEFKGIIMETIIDFWKEKDDIPLNILEFINNIQNKRVLVDSSGNFYCERCLNKLDLNDMCSVCKRKYTEYDKGQNFKYIDFIDDISFIKNENFDINYYVFDIVGSNVILYKILENIYFNNPIVSKPYKTSFITIDKAYKIDKEGFTELKENKYYSYIDIDNYVFDKNSNNNDYNLENEINDYNHNKFIYVDNIDLLKNTIYKYTHIWESKEYLKDCNINIANLIYSPIHFKQFEYLMKLKLYRLALDDSYLLNYDKEYKELFSNNDSLNFIRKNNFNKSDLEALLMCRKMDFSLIKFISDNLHIIKIITKLKKINLVELKKYFDKHNLDSSYLNEYYDYLILAIKSGLDIKDKNVLYPDDLINEHDKLYIDLTIYEDPNIDKKILELSSILNLNIYEDSKYIIFPASSIKCLVDESKQQKNCVRTYCKRYSNNESQIYFMRKKDNIKKSFVTIEVKDGKIVQARTKLNELPSDDINRILKKWESQIIPVVNE